MHEIQIADIFSKGCSSRREASIVKQIYQELVEGTVYSVNLYKCQNDLYQQASKLL